jgi:RNA polymerase sigma-70 factor (ECF subfamily)
VESRLNEASLETLLESYQQADAAATAELICRLSPGLLSYFLAQVGDRMEAEDLLQNTWLRIHSARHTYRKGAPVVPWVFAIAKHVKVDSYRKRHRIRKHEIVIEHLPEGPATMEFSRSETPTFGSLIAELPESQREVLTMLKVNGLTLDEVAQATSSTVGAVKQKASRAYAKLRASLCNSTSWGTGKKEVSGAR